MQNKKENQSYFKMNSLLCSLIFPRQDCHSQTFKGRMKGHSITSMTDRILHSCQGNKTHTRDFDRDKLR